VILEIGIGFETLREKSDPDSELDFDFDFDFDFEFEFEFARTRVCSAAKIRLICKDLAH
jgi:hypothetical protein